MSRLDLERVATSTFTAPLGSTLRYNYATKESQSLLNEVEGIVWAFLGRIVRSELNEVFYVLLVDSPDGLDDD